MRFAQSKEAISVSSRVEGSSSGRGWGESKLPVKNISWSLKRAPVKKKFESEYPLPHGFGVFLICTLQKGSNKCIPMVANFHNWIFMDLFCLKSNCLCLSNCVRNGRRRNSQNSRAALCWKAAYSKCKRTYQSSHTLALSSSRETFPSENG